MSAITDMVDYIFAHIDEEDAPELIEAMKEKIMNSYSQNVQIAIADALYDMLMKIPCKRYPTT